MTFRYLFSGRLAPFGVPVVTLVPGEGMKRIRIDEFALPLAERAKVHTEHGDTPVGQFGVVIRDRGWFVGDFWLFPDVIDEETEAGIRIGQPLSIGLEVTRSEPDREPGVEHVLQARLAEVSIVRTPLIEGAKIVSRSGPLKPTPPAATASYRLAPGDVEIPSTGQLIRRYYETPITIR